MNTLRHPKQAAKIIHIFHIFWIGLIITSLPIMLVYPRYCKIAVGLILTTVGSWGVSGDCPLFVWENRLLDQYNPRLKYSGSFLSHTLEKNANIRIPSAFFTVGGYIYGMIVVTTALLMRNKSS